MSSIKYRKRKKGKFQKIMIGLGIVIAIFLISAITILGMFSIKEIEISGNKYYTIEKIEEILMEGLYFNNSLELSWKFRNGAKDFNIPMISEIEVVRESSNRVRVRIYEKNLLGYVEYQGAKMYFDKDGIVIESSKEEIEKLPLITGLEFSKIVLYEELQVESEGVVPIILELTQLLKDVRLAPDKISFSSELDIALNFGNIKVSLGRGKNLEEKIFQLAAVLPSVGGQSGTLHMEKMGEGIESIVFTAD
jgi:Cell division septal protein